MQTRKKYEIELINLQKRIIHHIQSMKNVFKTKMQNEVKTDGIPWTDTEIETLIKYVSKEKTGSIQLKNGKSESSTLIFQNCTEWNEYIDEKRQYFTSLHDYLDKYRNHKYTVNGNQQQQSNRVKIKE